jgi:hypothetical protein
MLRVGAPGAESTPLRAHPRISGLLFKATSQWNDVGRSGPRKVALRAEQLEVFFGGRKNTIIDQKMVSRSVIELILLAVILLLILYWFFGGAAFAGWMTAYYTDEATRQSWTLRFYANVIVGMSLSIALIIGYIKLGTNRKKKK